MAIKFENITPGMILLDVHKEKLGRTSRSEWGEWRVWIVSVNKRKKTAIVRWNMINPEEEWGEEKLKKLHVKSPKCIRDQNMKR